MQILQNSRTALGNHMPASPEPLSFPSESDARTRHLGKHKFPGLRVRMGRGTSQLRLAGARDTNIAGIERQSGNLGSLRGPSHHEGEQPAKALLGRYLSTTLRVASVG